MQFVNTPSPQNIDADTIYLAEHHLYGSSRLGIKYYQPEQYRNIYTPGTPVAQVTSARVPWYSMAYEEMVKKGIRNPQSPPDRLIDTFRSIRDLGAKEYELTDHLGNVLANVLDRKTGYGAANLMYKGFHADVVSTMDYYPFGFAMSERSFSNMDYRFAYNGVEKVNELGGNGNHYTAFYGEADPRISRRWNLDPKPNSSWSSYSLFNNNPIWHSDILLDTPRALTSQG